MARPLSVTYVCTGNICRSPIGEVVLRDQLTEAGLAHQVVVTSAGTGDWHIGEPPDRRALATLRRRGHHGEDLRARQFRPEDFEDTDLVIALDRSHHRTLQALARNDEDRAKVRLLRSFDPLAVAGGARDVADPYFGSEADFEEAYTVIAAANHGLVAYLRELLEATP